MSERTAVWELASSLRASVAAAPDRTVPVLRKIRTEASRACAGLGGETVLALAEELLRDASIPRWLPYELIHHHPGAMSAVGPSEVRRLGRGMSSWGDVDSYACLVAGPAWREGRVLDREIHAWTESPDRWWRRAALVSTVPLNTAAPGGTGDAARTLAVCHLLEADRDDMVVKAMSWALRALAVRDRGAVEAYLERRGPFIAARVRREVRSKLDTGLKAPGRTGSGRRAGPNRKGPR